MFHACVIIFNVMEILKSFLILVATKQGLKKCIRLNRGIS